jgi:hypothetical protein
MIGGGFDDAIYYPKFRYYDTLRKTKTNRNANGIA